MNARPATPEDAPAINQIYNEGIEDRTATFETRLRTAEDIRQRVATLTGLSIRSGYEAKVADGLVSQVIKADTAQVPGIVQNMEKYRTWTDPMLRKEFDKAREGSVEKLHVSLALLPVDPSQVNYLYERLLLAEPSELAVIRDALWKQRTERESLTKQLWGLLADPRHNADQRFRAACALATYDADGYAKSVTHFKSATKMVYISNMFSLIEFLPLLLVFVFLLGKRCEVVS